MKLGRDTCVVIDDVIHEFQERHVPSEISKWEEERSSVWMTMVPLVHLAFAAGKEYCCNQTHGLKCDMSQSEVDGFAKSKQSGAVTTEVVEADKDDTKELQSGLHLFLNSKSREENHETSCKNKGNEGHTLPDNIWKYGNCNVNV